MGWWGMMGLILIAFSFSSLAISCAIQGFFLFFYFLHFLYFWGLKLIACMNKGFCDQLVCNWVHLSLSHLYGLLCWCCNWLSAWIYGLTLLFYVLHFLVWWEGGMGIHSIKIYLWTGLFNVNLLWCQCKNVLKGLINFQHWVE